MAIYLKQHQREKIGVDDNQAKQQQASLERQKQQQSNQSQKQLSAVTAEENKGNSASSGEAIKEITNKTASEEDDKKINTVKIAAAVEAGVAITEIATPASAVSGAIPSSSVAAAHGAPLVTGLTTVFGFF
jgi:hypothetical protein